MIPGTELRLKTMLRGMTESILPALDPDDSLAQEQAKLLIGHLHALLQQQGREAIVRRQEEEELLTLARFLLTIAEGGETTAQAIDALQLALAQNEGATVSIATEQLIRCNDASDSFKQRAWEPVLAFGRSSDARGKRWLEPMGF